MTAPVIQFKRGLLANLPGLREGEPAFTTDSYDLYVGLTSSTGTNKFFGSHRYWTKETTSTGSGLNLVEGTSNGSNFITIKAPDSLSADITYTMPGTDGSNGQVLATNGSGTLSFIDAAANLDIAGDSGTDTVALLTDTLTFAGTSNEIETAVTNNQIQIGLPDNVTIGDSITVTTNGSVGGALTVTGAVDFNGGADISGGETTLSSATVSDLTSGRVVVAGTSGALQDSANLTFSGSTLTVVGYADLDDVNVSSAATIASLTLSSGVAVTAILDEDTMTSDSASAVPTQQSVKAYVDTEISAIDLTITTAEGTNGTGGGGGSVATSQTFTFAGTTNEVDVTVAGQTVTYGLPSDVTVANNLTVSGNLYVNGSTTQVNTSQTTIEDQLLELGIVDGSAPSSDLNKDLGVLFNYYTSSAKKAAVYWDDSASRIVISDDVSESSGVLTAASHAALEIGSLWVNDCAGQSQVINCSGSERTLENITIDGGSF